MRAPVWQLTPLAPVAVDPWGAVPAPLAVAPHAAKPTAAKPAAAKPDAGPKGGADEAAKGAAPMARRSPRSLAAHLRPSRRACRRPVWQQTAEWRAWRPAPRRRLGGRDGHMRVER